MQVDNIMKTIFITNMSIAHNAQILPFKRKTKKNILQQ